MLGSSTERRQTKTFLNIKNGSVVKRVGDSEELFSYVEGRLSAIYKKEREFNGETVFYWYIELSEEEELYSIGFPYGSNVFKSIALSLATAKSYERIKIDPYLKDGFEKVSVYEGETRLNWVVKELPPVREVLIGGRKIKDDSERMSLIESYVEAINSKLGNKVTE